MHRRRLAHAVFDPWLGASQFGLLSAIMGIDNPLGPGGSAYDGGWDGYLQRSLRQDGSHPTVEGTYLAACVFYLVIFQRSPVGLGYHDGLPDKVAARDQQIAAGVPGTGLPPRGRLDPGVHHGGLPGHQFDRRGACR